METGKCPVCGRTVEIHKWVQYQDLEWVKCDLCRSGWLKNYESELKRTDHDVQEMISQRVILKDHFLEVAQEKAEWIVSELGQDMPVLELGAGPGAVFGQLKILNPALKYIAVEPNPIFEKILVEEGVQVRGGNPLEAIREICAQFRSENRPVLLLLDNVLEHIPHPLGLLKEINGLVVPGSKLLIEVPNEAGIYWRSKIHDFLRGVSKAPSFPGHINLFTKKGLTNLLSQIPCKYLRIGYHPIRKKSQVGYLMCSTEIPVKVDLALFFLKLFPIDYLLGIPYWLRATASLGEGIPSGSLSETD